MTLVSELREIFNQKLATTNNMDEAFVKAVWIAYLRGYDDGRKECADARGAEQDVRTLPNMQLCVLQNGYITYPR